MEEEYPIRSSTRNASALIERLAAALSNGYVYVVLRAPGQLRGRLSRRQRQVSLLVREGLDNPAIAERLGIKETTVSAHLRQIFGRLEIHSRSQLACLSLVLE